MRIQIKVTDKKTVDRINEIEYKEHIFNDINGILYVVVKDKKSTDVVFCFGLGTQTKNEIKNVFDKEFTDGMSEEYISIHVDIARIKIRIGKSKKEFTGRIENYEFLSNLFCV